MEDWREEPNYKVFVWVDLSVKLTICMHLLFFSSHAVHGAFIAIVVAIHKVFLVTDSFCMGKVQKSYEMLMFEWDL